MSEANSHTRLSHSKKLQKNVKSIEFSIILSTDEKIFSVATLKSYRMSDWSTCSNQQYRHRDKMPAVFSQSVPVSVFKS